MKLPVIFSLLAMSAGILQAQVDVSASLPATTFLKYEGIPLRMEITNNSGEELRLGVEDAPDILLLRVRDLDNRVMPRTELPFLNEPWIIKPGETSAKTFDLVQLFRISFAQSYRCLQDVQLAGESYTGNPLMFDVVNGIQEEQIKRRRSDRIFTMISIHRNGGDELMLRVTDFNNTMVLATYYLERHLRFYDPFMEVNKAGEIATLHYASPNQVVLCHFKADGTPIKRTYYEASAGVPVRLHNTADSGFMVEGAVEIEGQGNTSGAGGEASE
jgi:hypothetical protein